MPMLPSELHCHYRTDSYFMMGSGVNHFILSFTGGSVPLTVSVPPPVNT